MKRLEKWKQSVHLEGGPPQDTVKQTREERLQAWKERAGITARSEEKAHNTPTQSTLKNQSTSESPSTSESQNTSESQSTLENPSTLKSQSSDVASIGGRNRRRPSTRQTREQAPERPSPQLPVKSDTSRIEVPYKKEEWQVQKAALKAKFGDQGWQPRKKLSPDALEGIRALHAQYPLKFTTEVLASNFKISPEAIRRILKSRWKPSGEEAEDRRERWEKRGMKIWEKLVEQGEHAPKKWREMGIGAGGPRSGRKEWLEGLQERYRDQGRERPLPYRERMAAQATQDDDGYPQFNERGSDRPRRPVIISTRADEPDEMATRIA